MTTKNKKSEGMKMLFIRRKKLNKSVGIQSGQHWITIHPHGGITNSGGADGRHVLVDGHGNIVAGLGGKFKGQHIREAFRKEKRPHPNLSRHLTEQNVSHEMTRGTAQTQSGNFDSHHYKIGEGIKYEKDKFGRDTVAKGHVHFDKVVRNDNWGGQWVKLGSNFNDKDKLKSMGGRFNGDTKQWYIALKDVPNVARHFQHVVISPHVSHFYEKMHETQSASNMQPQIVITDSGKVEVRKPENTAWNGDMPDDMKHVNLYQHQKSAVEFLLKNKKAILGMAVGLGKTPSAITAANIALDKGDAERFAVIAPSSVKYQWKSEIEKFSNRKAVILDSSMSKKKLDEAFEEAKKADYVITNYEMLRNEEYADKIKELAGDAVIADEGHKVKNGTSQQTKAFSDKFKDAKYKWLLTATPFPNGQPRETHTMLSHANPKKAGTWASFSDKYAVMQTVNTPNGEIKKPVALKNHDKLREEMNDTVFLRHHHSPDVTNTLPSARHITHHIEMTKDQNKLYDAMREDLMHELEGMTEEQYKQNAANILTKMKRLEQIALDPDQLNPEKADMKKLYPKEQWAVGTTIDHLEDPKNRGMVIFSDSKLPLEKVKNGLIAEGISPNSIGIISGDVTPEKRKEVQDDFSSGKVKVVLATGAAEEGVNLQHGGHTLIHLDTPWVPKSITQREGRVLRTGQESEHTLFYSPTMKDTVEEQKRGKLAEKVGHIEKLLGEGSAGSVSENIASSAKAWSLRDIKEMLGFEEKRVKKHVG